jgi:hypothetical protein
MISENLGIRQGLSEFRREVRDLGFCALVLHTRSWFVVCWLWFFFCGLWFVSYGLWVMVYGFE